MPIKSISIIKKHSIEDIDFRVLKTHIYNILFDNSPSCKFGAKSEE